MGGEYMGLLETEALCSDGIQEELWSSGMLFDICLGGEDMDSSSRMGKKTYIITFISISYYENKEILYVCLSVLPVNHSASGDVRTGQCSVTCSDNTMIVT